MGWAGARNVASWVWTGIVIKATGRRKDDTGVRERRRNAEAMSPGGRVRGEKSRKAERRPCVRAARGSGRNHRRRREGPGGPWPVAARPPQSRPLRRRGGHSRACGAVCVWGGLTPGVLIRSDRGQAPGTPAGAAGAGQAARRALVRSWFLMEGRWGGGRASPGPSGCGRTAVREELDLSRQACRCEQGANKYPRSWNAGGKRASAAPGK